MVLVAHEIGYIQMDLMDMSAYKAQNKGFSYGLVLIDIYSRYGWVLPIKSKSGKDVSEAFVKWLNGDPLHGRKVICVYSDDGSEFKNPLGSILEKEGIRQKRVNSSYTHQVVAERFIRSIRQWIRDYWTERGNFDWIGVIDRILRFYNGRKHSGIKAIPKEVLEGKEQPVEIEQPVHDDLEVGTNVRVLVEKGKFDKPSLTGNYSQNVYRITERNGNDYTLDNGKTYQRWKLLVSKVAQKGVAKEQKQIRKQNLVKRVLKKESMVPSNIVASKRMRKENVRLSGYVKF